MNEEDDADDLIPPEQLNLEVHQEQRNDNIAQINDANYNVTQARNDANDGRLNHQAGFQHHRQDRNNIREHA